MSEEEVKGIIDLEKSELEEIGSFDGKMFPYFTVDGQQFFYKDQIDEWLNRKVDNSDKRTIYKSSQFFISEVS
ncbi:MAG: hypothetical protein K0R19_2521 [Bacillota bacterium]|jgi:hypothetical protein|nr:hypothetical protein [Bacillota bacterium]